jgi:hypothetical protein
MSAAISPIGRTTITLHANTQTARDQRLPCRSKNAGTLAVFREQKTYSHSYSYAYSYSAQPYSYSNGAECSGRAEVGDPIGDSQVEYEQEYEQEDY